MKSIDKLREVATYNPGFSDNATIIVLDYLSEIVAEIERDYMRLPRDADNEPIHVGDEIQFRNDSPITVDSIGTSRVYESDWGFFGSNGGFYGQGTMKNVHHVKPRTLEDVLVDMLEAAIGYSDAHTDVALVAVEKYADEIRELLGGDAE